ncbi:MAG: hypothetical protein QNK97_02810 [Gammaproteobacteria bacterium]
MKSPTDFIVTPRENKRYSNTKNIGGIDFLVSSSEEDVRYSNRYAEVKALPINYSGPIKEGDTLLVHHNVFKFYNDIRGQRRSGKSFLKDNLFLVDHDQYFAYKQDDVWHAHDRYCYIKPVKTKESIIFKNTKEEPLVGLVEIPNDKLISQGVKKGDLISFKPDSEYEFEVDGEKLYRMFDHQITMIL